MDRYDKISQLMANFEELNDTAEYPINGTEYEKIMNQF